MNAIYEVQTIDRATGAEHWVRVEAAGREQARERVTDLGEVVGEVRLIEVPAQKTPPLPGMVACPRCRGTEWTGGRGALVWIGVVLLFPVGLLLLFIRPTWHCARCGYSFQSFQAPSLTESDGPRGAGGVLYSIVYAILVVVAILLAVGVVALIVSDAR